MTIQELSDKLTILCHEGYAQATVKHISGEFVKNITGIELVGKDIALLTSRVINLPAAAKNKE